MSAELDKNIISVQQSVMELVSTAVMQEQRIAELKNRICEEQTRAKSIEADRDKCLARARLAETKLVESERERNHQELQRENERTRNDALHARLADEHKQHTDARHRAMNAEYKLDELLKPRNKRREMPSLMDAAGWRDRAMIAERDLDAVEDKLANVRKWIALFIEGPEQTWLCDLSEIVGES